MQTATEIKDILKNTPEKELDSFIRQYSDDDRAAVKKIVESAVKKKDKYLAELDRIEQMKKYEKEYGHLGYLCGIDEVGRGPLAGPVYAAAVILPADNDLLYSNDSKKLSEKKREALFDEIMEKAIAVGVGIVDEKVIDDINILQATYKAMRLAIDNLKVKPQILLNDAVIIPDVDIPQEKIIKGDAKSVSIAAASIIAKVTRDRLMAKYDEKYPDYGFAGHKGYGTAAHIEKIKEIGPCPIHRRSFIKNFYSE